MQTKHTLKCDLCSYIVEGINERGVKQGLGVHKRVVHGIKGGYKAVRERKRQAKLEEEKKQTLFSRGTKEQRRQWYQHVMAARERKDQKLSESDLGRPMSFNEAAQLTPHEKKIRHKLRQRAWWERNKVQRLNGDAAPTQPEPASPQAQPCKLSECPVCHARFYVCKGEAE